MSAYAIMIRDKMIDADAFATYSRWPPRRGVITDQAHRLLRRRRNRRRSAC